ncbi:MAG: methionine synthase [Methanosarcinales archaeon]
MQILFDDIGSYPPPEGLGEGWAEETIENDWNRFAKILQEAMLQKIRAGVDLPTYPQFQEMAHQFLKVIKDPLKVDEPYLVRERDARIVEVYAIEPFAREYREKHGVRMPLRLCVTGPLELYLKEFGATEYVDLYHLIARSINRFIRETMRTVRYSEVKVVSIDEPSLGISPQVIFDEDSIIKALSTSGESAKSHNLDVEIHLHSPLHYRLASQTENINVIGVESAANPSYLDLIDKNVLEETDSFLRIGIARTDIFTLTASLNEKYKINVWKEPSRMKEVITEMETPDVIEKRLLKAYNSFGERIRYAGPDCGLGAWPTQEMAGLLLRNTRIGIDRFHKDHLTKAEA